jgi:hypothetical protein
MSIIHFHKKAGSRKQLSAARENDYWSLWCTEQPIVELLTGGSSPRMTAMIKLHTPFDDRRFICC